MESTPTLPIPISYVSGRYLLFSIDAVTYLRREHNICGVLIGTLPQIPQQNVFLGLPLELMPEEARVLVDKDVACIVDEARAHDGMRSLLEEDRRQYLRDLESQGQLATRMLADRKDQQREQSLKEIEEKKAKHLAVKAAKAAKAAADAQIASSSTSAPTEKEEPNSVFAREDGSSSLSRTTGSSTPGPHQAMGITPTTSYPPLPHPVSSSAQYLRKPEVPLSYPLFAHLHSLGYFLSPGLRFGCQYVAYPGDPLRFHSHFVVVSAEWDQEMDLMDIVNGGRLGTGVKKGFLLGGPQKRRDEVDSEADRIETVRTFSIEWAGM
jgi:tRNA-splicing endonuclease subunit Sen34